MFVSSQLMYAMLWIVLALATMGLFTTYSHDPPLLSCPDPLTSSPRVECSFSPTYQSARLKFQSASKHYQATFPNTTHTYELLVMAPDLYIDVTLIRGLEDAGVLVHVSGTHGVEGFAGSAIQVQALKSLGRRRVRPKKSILFVHALNPFGMAKWRRTNERNVDLNRNAGFFKGRGVMERDPNIAGYEDWNDVFNPSAPPSFWGDVSKIVELIKRQVGGAGGVGKIKRAAVTGTYTRNQGIFFGGDELQASHRVMREFLNKQGFAQRFKNVVIVDVHTGLGPKGRDTLMLNEGDQAVKDMFTIPPPNQLGVDWVPPYAVEIQSLPAGRGNDASEGYDLTVGDVQASYPAIFTTALTNGTILSFTQEFGTVPGFSVMWKLIKENQAWHYGTMDQKANAAASLKAAFCPNSQRFALDVVTRGLLVIWRAAL